MLDQLVGQAGEQAARWTDRQTDRQIKVKRLKKYRKWFGTPGALAITQQWKTLWLLLPIHLSAGRGEGAEVLAI